MASEVIAVERVTKHYKRNRPALADVTFELGGDQIVGLLGQNGAGKTTLINVLMGFISPSGGTARLFGGRPNQSYSRIGYVPEHPAYHMFLSPYKLLLRLAAMRGIPKRQRSDRCEETLTRVGLRQDAGRPLWRLSKGLLQRFSLAQSLIHDPDLLILDEPMSGLDPVGQKEFRDIIGGAGRRGRTIIISSHLLFHLEKMCDTVLLMDEGALKYHGPPNAKNPAQAAHTRIRLACSLEDRHCAWLREAGALMLAQDEFEIGPDEGRPVSATIRYLLDNNLEIESLSRDQDSLEELFFSLIRQGG